MNHNLRIRCETVEKAKAIKDFCPKSFSAKIARTETVTFVYIDATRERYHETVPARARWGTVTEETT